MVDNQGIRTRVWRWVRWAALAAAGASCLAVGSHLRPASMLASGKQQPGVDPVREALEKWVETRRVISKEQADWLLSKELLEDRARLTESEISTLRKMLAELDASMAEATAKRMKLELRSQALSSIRSGAVQDLERVEGAVAGVVPRLPRPLREKVEPLAARMGGDHSSRTTAARLQAVVGILNEINKFNHAISTSVEILNSPDGRATEVSTLYLGVGQGYYLSSDGLVSGRGWPGEGRWEWVNDISLRDSLASAFKILRNESAAAYVLVPATIK